ncbi:MAG: cytochrome c biogenesis protein [Opitutales bacterium]
MKRLLPLAVAAALPLLAVFLVLRAATTPDYESAFDLERFMQLPAQEGGRIKPLDTIARNALLVIHGKQSYETQDGERVGVAEWFTELVLHPGQAAERRVFRIDHPDIVGLLGFPQDSRKFFSLNELSPHFGTLQEQFSQVDPEPSRRSVYERQLVKLSEAIHLYDLASVALVLPPLPEDIERTGMILQRLRELPIRPFPPRDGGDDWDPLGEVVLAGFHEGRPDPLMADYAALANAYRAANPADFAGALDSLYSELSDRVAPEQAGTIGFEFFFNYFAPFSQASALYVLAFLAAGFSWLAWRQPLVWAALGILVLAFLIHSFGILARMDIQDRPPVTNLYSSAIFVGWGAVLLCVILEAFLRTGIASAAAAIIAFPTLIIAHHLSIGGDTLEMMRAVLDSNFWLATHVVVVTLGYSATFLAGALAIIYLLLDRVVGPRDPADLRAIGGMVYGVLCFGLLFSFTGTVLGGIWADQSWGRFWGWDPKENGALMIVLWTALILHARWGKVAKPAGIMQLTIAGNIITAWSWFGTNLLGVGLHSYGFTDSGFFWLVVFAASQLFCILLGWLPARRPRPEPSDVPLSSQAAGSRA